MIASLLIRFVVIAGLLIGGIVWAASGHLLVGMSIHGLTVCYLLVGTLNPSSRLFGPVRTRCDDGIWLTLDDGPDPVDTPAILDLLDQHRAKATFFVIGEKAAEHPGLIREIHRRGHQIGNHTWSHPQATFWCHGPLSTYREIARCQQVLSDILGQAPQVFRAPVGHYNVFVHPVLKHFGLNLIGWSSRGFDGVDSRLADVTRRIRNSAAHGSIVLAHEATPIAREVAADILNLAERNGWTCTIPAASPESGNC